MLEYKTQEKRYSFGPNPVFISNSVMKVTIDCAYACTAMSQT